MQFDYRYEAAIGTGYDVPAPPLVVSLDDLSKDSLVDLADWFCSNIELRLDPTGMGSAQSCVC